MPKLSAENIKFAEHLMFQSKFNEALEILNNLDRDKSLTTENEIKLLLLKGRINLFKQDYKKAIEYGEIGYQLSQKAGFIIKIIDALIIKAHVFFLGDYTQTLEILSEIEEIIGTDKILFSPSFLEQRFDYNFIKSRMYLFTNKMREAEELLLKYLSNYKDKAEKLEISLIFWQLGEIYLYKRDYNLGLDYASKSLKLQEHLTNPIGIASSLSLIGLGYYAKGDFNQALIYCKQCLAINQVPVSAKASCYHTMGVIYKDRGELDRTIRYYTRAATLVEKEGYFDEYLYHMVGIGSTYRMKGDLERAIECLQQCLEISEKIDSQYGINASLFYLVLTHLDKKSYEQAHLYLDRLEQITDNTESMAFNDTYKIAKAIALKQSGRIRNFSKAENLFRQITEDESSSLQIYLLAIVNLCELYLIELNMTNNPEVLEEINPLINKMYNFSENQNSYLWLAETKLLQAKLALIQTKVEDAKQLFTAAEKIAEIHGLNSLAMKISNEHDNLLEQLNLWDILDENNAPMSERIKLASLNGVIDRIKGRGSIESLELTPEKPVLLLLIGEGGFPLLTYSFTQEWTFEEELVSAFLSAFNTFSGELFSKGLDRAKFGEYTILMKPVLAYYVCYLFKGKTYLAKKKLDQFIERIESSESIWQILDNHYKTSQVISLKNAAILDSLITDIFLGNE